MLVNKYKPQFKSISKRKYMSMGEKKSRDILHLLNNMYFHKDILKKLYIMSQDSSIPHIIFYGPEGCGKKTTIQLFLEMLFNKQIRKKYLTDCKYEVSSSGSKSNDVIIKQSNYHIIINPNNNNADKYLIQDVVKEYAKRMPLNVFTNSKPFKVVLINNADNLSHFAQTSLRRTMEKYSSTCRFIMWCKSLSKVIDPIRSRCYLFRIKAPSNKEILNMVMDIAFKENIKLNMSIVSKILQRANGNIKIALWLLELHKWREDILSDNLISYDNIIKEISQFMLSCNTLFLLSRMENNKQVAGEIRDRVYNLLISNIDGTKIITDVMNELLKSNRVPIVCKYNIPELASKYEFNLIRKRRSIFHLEAFVLNVMNMLNEHMTSKDKEYFTKQCKILIKQIKDESINLRKSTRRQKK